jgi:hypothetical protein
MGGASLFIGLLYIYGFVGIFLKQKKAVISIALAFIVNLMLMLVYEKDIEGYVIILPALLMFLSLLAFPNSFASSHLESPLVSEGKSIIFKKIFKIASYASAIILIPTILLLTFLITNNQSEKGVEYLVWEATLEDGRHYEGKAVDGTPHGKGTLTWPNGQIYEGDFVSGVMHGRGKLTDANGMSYDGLFKNGFPHGKGKCSTPTGETRECFFENGKQI